MNYYSAESANGSPSSHGFSNDTIVRVFNDKKARDTYVDESRNLSCIAIKRSEVTRHAANASLTCNHPGTPYFWSGEFYGITEYDGDIAGQIGFVEVVDSNDDFRTIERFHK